MTCQKKTRRPTIDSNICLLSIYLNLVWFGGTAEKTAGRSGSENVQRRVGRDEVGLYQGWVCQSVLDSRGSRLHTRPEEGQWICQLKERRGWKEGRRKCRDAVNEDLELIGWRGEDAEDGGSWLAVPVPVCACLHSAGAHFHSTPREPLSGLLSARWLHFSLCPTQLDHTPMLPFCKYTLT